MYWTRIEDILKDLQSVYLQRADLYVARVLTPQDIILGSNYVYVV
jgi:hypothetical protein